MVGSRGERSGSDLGGSSGATGLYAATRPSLPAPGVTTTALRLGWAAFAMHLAVSVSTPTAMPGVVTSLDAGTPGAALGIRRIWA